MVLEISNLKKSFGRKVILKDVNLTVERGELVGITGENGSGKTTILKIITGNLRSKSGQIKMFTSMGYCPQECVLFPQLSVKENFQYFSAAYGLNKVEFDKQLDYFGLYFNFTKYLDQKVKNLSGGTKQKVNLCLALFHNPDFLILDEPYNGFDWNTYNFFWEYSKLLKERQCAVLIVAHLLTNTEVFDKVYELKDGVLI